MQEQDKVKIKTKFFIENPWKVFFWEAVLFSLTLGLGIATAFRLNRFLEQEAISPTPISFSQFVFYFILVNVLVVLLVFFGFKKAQAKILRGLFLFSLGFSSLLLINAWIPDILALALVFFLLWLWLKKSSVLIHDLLMILAMAGAGSILGLRMDPKIVVLLLIVFSIYDFIAVYKTKHMVKIAQEMAKKGALIALMIPQKISDFSANLKQIEPGGKFLILGGGDIVFPLLFCSSLISQGILRSLIVAAFSLLGLFASFLIFVFQKQRRPLPALPPIALFSIIGFLISQFF